MPSENLNPSESRVKTVFLAEDDPFISRMYVTKLESAGYRVVTASNGRDAYEIIKEHEPHLVMLDINMPELTGLEVAQAVTKEGLIEPSKILILTNSANPADRDKTQAMGIEYMVKADLTPRDVLEKINQKISQGSS